jgi:hypothetical protein
MWFFAMLCEDDIADEVGVDRAWRTRGRVEHIPPRRVKTCAYNRRIRVGLTIEEMQ